MYVTMCTQMCKCGLSTFWTTRKIIFDRLAFALDDQKQSVRLIATFINILLISFTRLIIKNILPVFYKQKSRVNFRLQVKN